MAVIKFKNGGVGNIVVPTARTLALYGKVHIFGENGAGVGVQTDGGAMFIAGMSSITEPPVQRPVDRAGERTCWRPGRRRTADFFNSVDSMYYYHRTDKGLCGRGSEGGKASGGRQGGPQDRGVFSPAFTGPPG